MNAACVQPRKYDRLIQAAYFACIAIGADPTVRNVTKATAKIRSVTGQEKPVWGEHVRLWLKQKHENDTQTIPARYGHDTSSVLEKRENDTEASEARYPRAGVVKELELEAVSSSFFEPTSSVLETETRARPKKPSSGAKPQKPQRVAVEPPASEPIDFGDQEGIVAEVVAAVASGNHDGKISTSRIASIRKDLKKALDRFGPEIFSSGIEIALSREPPLRDPVAYAKGCMRKEAERQLPDSGGKVVQFSPRSRREEELNSSDKLPTVSELYLSGRLIPEPGSEWAIYLAENNIVPPKRADAIHEYVDHIRPKPREMSLGL